MSLITSELCSAKHPADLIVYNECENVDIRNLVETVAQYRLMSNSLIGIFNFICFEKSKQCFILD